MAESHARISIFSDLTFDGTCGFALSRLALSPFYLLTTGCVFVTSILASPWVLANSIAGFLGKISFSFYLLHFAVLQNVSNWMPGHPARSIAIALIVTTTLSICTYAAIEVPMRRLIRRLGSYHTRPVHPTSA